MSQCPTKINCLPLIMLRTDLSILVFFQQTSTINRIVSSSNHYTRVHTIVYCSTESAATTDTHSHFTRSTIRLIFQEQQFSRLAISGVFNFSLREICTFVDFFVLCSRLQSNNSTSHHITPEKSFSVAVVVVVVDLAVRLLCLFLFGFFFFWFVVFELFRSF